MRPLAAIRTCLRRYAAFQGRAGRAEYWWFLLFVVIGGIAGSGLDRLCWPNDMIDPLATAFRLATALPLAAVGARRLHDVDRRLWWQIPVFLPSPLAAAGATEAAFPIAVFAAISVLVMGGIALTLLCQRGDLNPNRFGPPSPLTPPA